MGDSMSGLTGIMCVVPSRLGVGEPFSLKTKLLGPLRKVPSAGAWNTPKPGLRGPFNLNVQRRIQFMDNCLPEWSGKLIVEDTPGLEGSRELIFDGTSQGVYADDNRPIKSFSGFRWTEPGFHFLRVVDPESGITGLSNPVRVTDRPPALGLYWGDPHWQTFFSDGIRCPEELYAFAREEAFLDFGSISDHMEALTDRQWEYFQAVTDDYNEPHRFVTLHGQEWTHHLPDHGAPGHRNVYFARAGGPALRCTDEGCNTLEELWKVLDGLPEYDPIAIPHHSANTVMGVDWEQGWNPKYEKAVEIYSVWGSSEKPAEQGNPRPIYALDGETAGRHVVDALDRGYRFGFVGGGDIHDGRPGDDLHNESYPPRDFRLHPQGFTAAFAPALTRRNIHQAIKTHRTYATTKCRIYLDVAEERDRSGTTLRIEAASEDGIECVCVVRNGEDVEVLEPERDPRVVQAVWHAAEMGPGDYCYVRVVSREGRMAWSSPVYGNSHRGAGDP
ncbi:MAG: DUF3604 domain-containing protein [Candidatus Brocadiia bacterium]